MQNPLNKVVFIQKVVAFTKTKSLKGRFRKSVTHLLQLAYVNNSWNDTIKNYAFHLFERQVCDIEDTYEIKKICDRLIKCGIIWFVNVVMSSKTLLNRVNVPRLVCEYAPSRLDMIQLVFDRIVEAGGGDLLKSQVAATDYDGRNCLMFCCEHPSSPEVMKLIFEKIIEVGKEFLKNQLVAKIPSSGKTFLMLCCIKSSSPEIVKLVFEKIDEAGGADLLKSQLIATDRWDQTCLMLGCSYSKSPEVMKLIFEKILEMGDTALLKSQLSATNSAGKTCLMVACDNSSSPEVVTLIFEKILEMGDTALLKSQLSATNSDGETCLMVGCRNSSSPEVMKLVFEKIVQMGGRELLESQLSATNRHGSGCLKLCCPQHNELQPQLHRRYILQVPFSFERSSLSTVEGLVATVLFEFALFNQQYSKLDENEKKHLKKEAGIESSSWTPNSAGLAEVKQMLEGKTVRNI